MSVNEIEELPEAWRRVKAAEPDRVDDIVYLTEDELQVQLARRGEASDRAAPWLLEHGQPTDLKLMVKALRSIVLKHGKLTYPEVHAVCGALGIPKDKAASVIARVTFERIVE